MAQLTAGFEKGCDILAALEREHAVIQVFRDASLLEKGCASAVHAMNLQWVKASVTKSLAAGILCESFAALRRGQHGDRVIDDEGAPSSFSSPSIQELSLGFDAANLRRDNFDHRARALELRTHIADQFGVHAIGDENAQLAAFEALGPLRRMLKAADFAEVLPGRLRRVRRFGQVPASAGLSRPSAPAPRRY